MSDARVLIIEDEQDIREILRLLLEDEGLKVACAENGAQALDWLEAHAPPCLILLDLMMPVMDGRQFLVELKRRQESGDLPYVPVAVVSALADRVKLPEYERLDFFRKPPDLPRLLDLATAHCPIGSKPG